MGRILVGNGHSDGGPTVVGFRSDSRRRNCDGFLIFHFRDLRDCEKQFPNHRFRRVAFMSKNGHSEGAPAVGGFQSGLRPLELRGF